MAGLADKIDRELLVKVVESFDDPEAPGAVTAKNARLERAEQF
jgi:hypothetical protein